MRVFAIINHKGGSTKTTTTEHLADILTESGSSVCLIDLDTSYNLSNFYNVNAKKNIINFLNGDKKAVTKITDRLSIVAGTKKISQFDSLYYSEPDMFAVLKTAIDALPFDIVLIDTPHSIGNIIKNAIYAADTVIMPVMPNRDSADGSVDVIDEIAELKAHRKDVNVRPCLLPAGFSTFSMKERAIIPALASAHKGIEILPKIPYKRSIKDDQSERIVRRNTNVYKAYKEVAQWLLK